MAQRALMMSEWIMDEAKSHSIDSVGGLMQVHFVEAGGVRAIPYERWIDLDERYGTHVSMDIDPAGAWVQSHQPTGLRVPLRFPDDHDFGAKSVNFELERLLTKNSPGVQLTPNPVAVFRPLQFDSRGWFVRTP